MNRLSLLRYLVGGVFFMSVASVASQPKGVSKDELVLLVGSYSSAAEQGMGVFRFNSVTGEWRERSRTSGVENSSYLTVDLPRGWVYSVAESDQAGSSLALLKFDPQADSLILTQSVPIGESSPCYVEVDPMRNFVVTANYGGGSLSLFSLDQQGRVEGLAQTVRSTTSGGSGFWKERQRASHMHCVRLSPDGRTVWSSDLGNDRISRYRIEQCSSKGVQLADEGTHDGGRIVRETVKGEARVEKSGFGGRACLNEESALHLALRPGSGPRHIEFHPSGKWIYVINELGGTVVSYSVKGEQLKLMQYIACDTVAGDRPKGAADIHVSPDGRFLYASNRITSDGIAIFSIHSKTGELTRVGFVPTEKHPRNFVITPNGRFLLCASRDANVIQVFERDSKSGMLRERGRRIEFKRPVCLKFAPGW